MTESPVGENARILIVDDEPFNVDLVSQELEDFGYVAEPAYGGREALDPCCGPGRRRLDLARRGRAATGVDRSPFPLAEAGARVLPSAPSRTGSRPTRASP